MTPAPWLVLVLFGVLTTIAAFFGWLIWLDYRNGKPVTFVQWAALIAVVLLTLLIALPVWIEVAG